MRPDRIEVDKPVLVDVIECGAQPDLENTSMSGRTVDISESGMRLVTETKLPQGTLVSVRLDFATELYRLVGHVRWAETNGPTQMGLLLDEGHSPDMAAWTQSFHLDYLEVS